MPLILVVEQEKRYVERIEEALGPQGWDVLGVDDRAGVLRLMADRAADLLVVNAEVDEADELVSSFSRAAGGPGTVALVPETGDNAEIRAHADEVLEKPFTDQDLRLAVRRCVSAGREKPPAEAPAEAAIPMGERLSSEELFGDVVLELEDAFSVGVSPQALAEAEVDELEVVEVEMEAEAEIDQALSGITAEEPRAEEAPPVVEPVVEAPVAEPQVTGEPAVEELEPEFEEAVEEEPEQPVEEELEVEVPEETGEEEPEEEPEAAEEPEEEEPEIEASEEAPEVVGDELPKEEEELLVAAEIPKPHKPDLEERLREAVLAGKAAAAQKEEVPAREVDSAAAADLLLQKALGTLSWGAEVKPEIDEEFAAPAHATEEEIDELVGTVVSEKTDEKVEDVDEIGEEDGYEAPGLDVVEAEMLERDEGEYRDRMKLVWAIIVIALLALLAFVVTSRWGGDTEPDQPEIVAPAAVEAEDPVVELDEPGDPQAGDAPEGTEDGANVGDSIEENGGDV